jgi:hypothetical protein
MSFKFYKIRTMTSPSSSPSTRGAYSSDWSSSSILPSSLFSFFLPM